MTLRVVPGPELTGRQVHDLLRLRFEVFVLEQRCFYPEIDGRDLDDDAVHVWWQPAERVLGCLRVLGAPGGTRRVTRVCTAADARGTGLGGMLMAAAVDLVGADPSVLDAQVQAKGLYARFGYETDGEPFEEDGIMHVRMRRPATA
ncbi:GNAT family N-acetyltransferase [Actinokineospora bangkokensis]|uniref:GNAT family N-acetyltransferase n=1 Tax=Actinokineospora bangkokensis TaxID=1193682 RepID=A0A1Q9LHH8_9PSEU|nr:GNAT family N-acetyltransferase [Actinokineospora bangkokensis]OLR91507.1 GNAT family N-acetyltransferase [Actinokineospora bangkokensis]